ncbi:uncharacterized protein CC84DRAFT_1211364 [Paraphaeosphaeria sporulosa]|uniref:Uncharacterized protein n=1 Tax=Paraphaeosphaeria sporulosa TaxID=1460663 RepID=A0A177CXV1_9PLEO|nr:uncharacterized protein CC84DRAFT_1211364 [Paraphaeosphaeria sporulosa]OAG11722.1 hypothetical protein CC84DRAFT_1211364 [Paraphaeosphaeria sporulosa]
MQSAEQLSPNTFAAGAGPGPLEGEAYYQGLQKDVAASGDRSESNVRNRHHHRRGASARKFANAAETSRNEDIPRSQPMQRQPAALHHASSLSLTPLPTIETILSSSPPTPIYHQSPAPTPSSQPQPAYKTKIHIPKPPTLRRRHQVDPDTLEELLRAADRRAQRKSSSGANFTGSREVDVAADADVEMPDMRKTDRMRQDAADAADAYPSPPPSPLLSPADVWFTPKVSSTPALQGEAMDWDWGDGGEMDEDVVYGAAGLALSPRAMKGAEGRCCRCGGLELYDIAEESEDDGSGEDG